MQKYKTKLVYKVVGRWGDNLYASITIPSYLDLWAELGHKPVARKDVNIAVLVGRINK